MNHKCIFYRFILINICIPYFFIYSDCGSKNKNPKDEPLTANPGTEAKPKPVAKKNTPPTSTAKYTPTYYTHYFNSENVGLVIIKRKHAETGKAAIDGPFVLVHKRSKGLAEPGTLCGPGGAKDGDTPEVAAIRETREESQLVINKDKLTKIGFKNNLHMFLYICANDTKVLGPEPAYAKEVDTGINKTDYEPKPVDPRIIVVDAGGHHLWLNEGALMHNQASVHKVFYDYALVEIQNLPPPSP